MDSNALTKKPSASLDEVLSRIEKQWQHIGITKTGVGKEVYKVWLEEYGWKTAIVTLMELRESDPKGFLQAFCALNEYVTPKSVRQSGDQSKGLSISFNMPSSDKLIEPKVEEARLITQQMVEP